MKRKYRKPKPSIPNREFIWYGYLDDNCWVCPNHKLEDQRSCHHCKWSRKWNAKEQEKEWKRRGKDYD